MTAPTAPSRMSDARFTLFCSRAWFGKFHLDEPEHELLAEARRAREAEASEKARAALADTTP